MNDYGISDTELKIICGQIERRSKCREEFMRLRTDPCKNAMEAGHVFNPALQRFIAMKACHLERFQVNSKTIFFGISTVLPMIIYGYFIWKQRTKFEQDCRCGRLRYRDRRNKLA